MLRKPKRHFFRNTFLTGLLILLPLFVTYILVSFLFNLFSGVGAPFLKALFGILSIDSSGRIESWEPIVNIVLVLTVIFILGLIGTNIVGRRIIAAMNALLMRVPLVNTIYGAVKQVVETFQGPGKNFQRVVLIQFPVEGSWMMGLVGSERTDHLNLFRQKKMISVFVPTTPNPTSGYLFLVSPADVIELNYNVEEAFKFIVSSGIIGKQLASHKLTPSR